VRALNSTLHDCGCSLSSTSASTLPDLLQEFVTGLSVLARGTIHEKLQWAFNLYDTDDDGVITREELLDVVSAIYDLMGKYAEPVITPDTASEHVDRVFQVLVFRPLL